MILDEARCENCVFWFLDKQVPNEGECRFKPPQTFVILGPGPLGQPVPQMISFFPRTRKELCCGEFKPRVNV